MEPANVKILTALLVHSPLEQILNDQYHSDIYLESCNMQGGGYLQNVPESHIVVGVFGEYMSLVIQNVALNNTGTSCKHNTGILLNKMSETRT